MRVDKRRLTLTLHIEAPEREIRKQEQMLREVGGLHGSSLDRLLLGTEALVVGSFLSLAGERLAHVAGLEAARGNKLDLSGVSIGESKDGPVAVQLTLRVQDHGTDERFYPDPVPATIEA
jgi:hypothetical protein